MTEETRRELTVQGVRVLTALATCSLFSYVKCEDAVRTLLKRVREEFQTAEQCCEFFLSTIAQEALRELATEGKQSTAVELLDSLSDFRIELHGPPLGHCSFASEELSALRRALMSYKPLSP